MEETPHKIYELDDAPEEGALVTCVRLEVVTWVVRHELEVSQIMIREIIYNALKDVDGLVTAIAIGPPELLNTQKATPPLGLDN